MSFWYVKILVERGYIHIKLVSQLYLWLVSQESVEASAVSLSLSYSFGLQYSTVQLGNNHLFTRSAYICLHTYLVYLMSLQIICWQSTMFLGGTTNKLWILIFHWVIWFRKLYSTSKSPLHVICPSSTYIPIGTTIIIQMFVPDLSVGLQWFFGDWFS